MQTKIIGTGGPSDKLVPLLSPECVFVWEMSPRKTVAEIRRSVVAWKERFAE